MKVMATENGRKSKLQSGQVFDLGKLDEYGEGAVVSRTRVENNAGTVTLFAFDKDQGLSEHTATFDACQYPTRIEGLHAF